MLRHGRVRNPPSQPHRRRDVAATDGNDIGVVFSLSLGKVENRRAFSGLHDANNMLRTPTLAAYL
jgi:hypothetical protein